MSEFETSANREILNLPVSEATEEISAVAVTEKKRFGRTATELSFHGERLDLQNERLRDENEQLKDIHELRKEYIPKLYWLTVAWLAFVVVLISKVAAGPYFYLSDQVLIALVTSTTVNVIGIFMLAARWLFRAGR